MSDAEDQMPGKDTDRPLVTFALFAYNQEKYIREAVEGAFAQTYEPLEIILSDDCSTDNTFEIMRNMAMSYRGPHEVRVRRNEKNVGLADHINKVMESINESLIVVAAGDDISLPERTASLVNFWILNSRFSGSLYSHFRLMSERGVLLEPFKRKLHFKISLKDRNVSMLNNFSGLSGCSHAWTKDVFEIFGPLDSKIQHEDISIPLRSLLIGSIGFIPDDLVYYRQADGSITRKTFSGASDRYTQMNKYWIGRIAVFEQFELDLRKLETSDMQDISNYNWIKEQTEIGKSYAIQQVKLYSGRSWYRLQTSLNPLSHLTRRDRIKWTILAFLPFLYGRHLKIPNFRSTSKACQAEGLWSWITRMLESRGRT